MGKKRKARRDPETAPAGLTHDDEMVTLSWRDFTLTHKEIDFDSTIVEKLQGCHTLQAIERKLHYLWKNYGLDTIGGSLSSTWRNDIGTYGSSCLGLIEEEKETIAALVEQFEKEFSTSVQTRRQLRSTSRLSPTPPIPLFASDPSRSRSTTTPSGQRRRTQTKSLTPFVVKKESHPSRETPPSQLKLTNGKKLKTYSKRRLPLIYTVETTPHTLPEHQNDNPAVRNRHLQSLTILRDSEESSSDILDIQQDEGREIKKSVEDGRIEVLQPQNNTLPDNQEHQNDDVRCACGAKELPEYKKADWIACEKCKIWQHTACIFPRLKYSCEQCEPPLHLKALRREIGLQTEKLEIEAKREEDPRLSSALTEIRSLKEKLSEKDRQLKEAKQSLDDLDSEVKLLEFARQKRDEKLQWPIHQIEELVVGYEKQVADLVADLDARHSLGSFAKLTTTSPGIFRKTVIESGFKDAYSQSRQILCRQDSPKLPYISSLEPDEQLFLLISKILGPGITPKKAIQTLLRVNPHAVVRAVTTSALREWVFATEFPLPFDSEPSSVLAKYREHLGTQDGALVLRNLDLAVLHSLIKDESFRNETIIRKADELSTKFSKTLAPLFSDTPESATELHWNGFSTWRHGKEEWEERQGRLNDMFKDALKTKADSCLNILDYEMVIYRPGTVFDANTMDVETMEGMQDLRKDHTGRVVRLCIEAAVFAYERKPPSIETSISDALVPGKNFVEKTASERVEVKPLVKAVVILSDKN